MGLTAPNQMGTLGKLGFVLSSIANPNLPFEYQNQLADQNERAKELEFRRQERAFKLAEIERQRQQQEMQQQFLGRISSPQTVEGQIPAGQFGPGAPVQAVPQFGREQIMEGLASGISPKFLGNLSSLLNPAPEYKTVGDTVLMQTPEGLQPVYRGLSSLQENIQDLALLSQLPPEVLGNLEENVQKFSPLLGGGGTTVNVSTQDALENVASKEAQKIYGGGVGQRANSRITLADEALNQNLQLDIITDALARGAETGLGQSQIASINNLYASLTGSEPPDNLAPTELIRGIGGQLSLRFRNPDSGLGLPGATSNTELQFLKSIAPSLELSKDGNVELIKAFKRVNKLKTDMAEYQQTIISENNGVIPNNIDLQMREFVKNYELFSPEERKRLENFLEQNDSQQSEQKFTTPSGITYTVE